VDPESGVLYQKYSTDGGSTWLGWYQFPDTVSARPAATAWTVSNRIDVFYRGTDNLLYQKAWDGTGWVGRGFVGAQLNSAPGAVWWMLNGRLDAYVRTTGTPNNLNQIYWPAPTDWSSWIPVVGYPN
jgi:hypothetical protein